MIAGLLPGVKDSCWASLGPGELGAAGSRWVLYAASKPCAYGNAAGLLGAQEQSC